MVINTKHTLGLDTHTHLHMVSTPNTTKMYMVFFKVISALFQVYERTLTEHIDSGRVFTHLKYDKP